jgi:hypothetical protein
MTGLTPNTIYWYKVTSLNYGGESLNAVPVRVITKKVGGADGDGGLTFLESPEIVDFMIYPNPVKTGQPFFIKTENLTEISNIEMIGLTCKKIYLFLDNNTLVAPDNAGIYFLQIRSKQNNKVYKLILE